MGGLSDTLRTPEPLWPGATQVGDVTRVDRLHVAPSAAAGHRPYKETSFISPVSLHGLLPSPLCFRHDKFLLDVLADPLRRSSSHTYLDECPPTSRSWPTSLSCTAARKTQGTPAQCPEDDKTCVPPLPLGFQEFSSSMTFPPIFLPPLSVPGHLPTLLQHSRGSHCCQCALAASP